jgi:hypothetical protein
LYSNENNKQILESILAQAENGIFKNRAFYFDGIRKRYGPIYGLFRVKTKFSARPSGNIEFKCLVCDSNCFAKLGEPSNLHKHLLKHKKTREWCELYRQREESPKGDVIDEDTMLLIKFFISSNLSATILQNVHLRSLFTRHKIPFHSETTFIDKYLPSVLDKLYKRIQFKLVQAVNVVVIADCWSNKQMLSFMGVAANIVYENFTNECIVIGFELMEGKSDHLGIKKAIESILNKYEFDKSKVTGIFVFSLIPNEK